MLFALGISVDIYIYFFPMEILKQNNFGTLILASSTMGVEENMSLELQYMSTRDFSIFGWSGKIGFMKKKSIYI